MTQYTDPVELAMLKTAAEAPEIISNPERAAELRMLLQAGALRGFDPVQAQATAVMLLRGKYASVPASAPTVAAPSGPTKLDHIAGWYPGRPSEPIPTDKLTPELQEAMRYYNIDASTLDEFLGRTYLTSGRASSIEQAREMFVKSANMPDASKNQFDIGAAGKDFHSVQMNTTSATPVLGNG